MNLTCVGRNGLGIVCGRDADLVASVTCGQGHDRRGPICASCVEDLVNGEILCRECDRKDIETVLDGWSFESLRVTA